MPAAGGSGISGRTPRSDGTRDPTFQSGLIAIHLGLLYGNMASFGRKPFLLGFTAPCAVRMDIRGGDPDAAADAQLTYLSVKPVLAHDL
jgi:hypothetical protein